MKLSVIPKILLSLCLPLLSSEAADAGYTRGGATSTAGQDGGSRDLTTTSSGSSSSRIRIPRDFSFVTVGSGEQEVPPVASRTRAVLSLTVDPALTKFSYKLEVFGGAKITQAHLHCEAAGKNGPVAVFLFPLTTAGRDVDGTLSRGTFRAANMTATPCGNSTVTFFESIKAGRVYLNVHSVKNPGGEVRGQLYAFPV